MHLPLYSLQAFLISTWSGAIEKSLAPWPLQLSFSSYWLHRLNSLNLFSLDRDANHLPKYPLGLSSFKTILLVWEGPKTQYHSPGNTDLKENTSFLWPHCSCRCWRHTARFLKTMMCWTLTETTRLSESYMICVCFKVIYNLWQILFLSPVHSFKACHYSKTFGRHLLFIVDYIRYQLKI